MHTALGSARWWVARPLLKGVASRALLSTRLQTTENREEPRGRTGDSGGIEPIRTPVRVTPSAPVVAKQHVVEDAREVGVKPRQGGLADDVLS